MIDIDSVDMEEFREKFEQYIGLNETRDSINHSMNEIKTDIASLIGVNKRKVGAVIKMLINMREEGQPLDEDLASGVKELYLKAKETDDV